MADAQVKQLSPGQQNLSQFEYSSNRFDARIPTDVSVEDLLKPEYWAHHANLLKPRDEIRACSDDNSWVAYLIVVDSGRTWAKTQVLSQHSLIHVEASTSEVQTFIDAHEVKWRGPHKWSVARKADGAIVQEGLSDREQATQWLDNHARQQTGIAKAA